MAWKKLPPRVNLGSATGVKRALIEGVLISGHKEVIGATLAPGLGGYHVDVDAALLNLFHTNKLGACLNPVLLALFIPSSYSTTPFDEAF